MNKLNDLIASAAKLAAQKPDVEDEFDWKRGEFEKAADAWYRRMVLSDGNALFVDISDNVLNLRNNINDSVTVVWYARSMPANHCLPKEWRYSQRLPCDLGQTDEEILSKINASDSVLEFQKAALVETSSETWLANHSVDKVVAPFLMNNTSNTVRDLALKEFARVLSKGGVFKTIVLAADEPLEATTIDFDGVQCTVFPQEDTIEKHMLAAGFHGIEFSPMLNEPIKTVRGVELRAFVVQATTGTKGVCLEQGDAAIYLGPWSKVLDDDGHEYPRGKRIAVCAKTASVLQKAPYKGAFLIVKAYGAPLLEDAALFDCTVDVIRPVAVTKGVQPIGGADSPFCTDGDCGC